MKVGEAKLRPSSFGFPRFHARGANLSKFKAPKNNLEQYNPLFFKLYLSSISFNSSKYFINKSSPTPLFGLKQIAARCILLGHFAQRSR